jgi:hypothetical protein
LDIGKLENATPIANVPAKQINKHAQCRSGEEAMKNWRVVVARIKYRITRQSRANGPCDTKMKYEQRLALLRA